MTSDAAWTVVHCGRAAGYPNHRDGAGPVGKGMAGDPQDLLPTIPLCRDAHNLVHARRLKLSLVALPTHARRNRAVACGWEGDKLVFERGFDECDDDFDSRFWTDGKLANEYIEGNDVRRRYIAFQFFRRYANFDHWEERVAEIVSDETGQHVHWRRIEEHAALHLAFWNQWERAEKRGPTRATAVAKSGDPEKALAVAEAARDAGGRTGASIIREIKGQAEPEPKKCPHCGGTL